MSEGEERLHVIPLGEHWEVESESGAPLLHEEEKTRAVESAKDLAREQGIQHVVIHDGDGVTEDISLPPTA